MAGSFVDDSLLADIDDIRSIPGEMGLHPFVVTLRVNAWDGGAPGLGNKTATDTPLYVGIGQNPKVQQLSNQDALLSGGVYSNQDVKIGPLTPPFTGGGVAYASLDPAMNPGTEFFFRIAGPGLPAGGAWYARIRDEADSALHIYVIVRAIGVQNP